MSNKEFSKVIVEQALENQFRTLGLFMSRDNMSFYEQYVVFARCFQQLTTRMRLIVETRTKTPGSGFDKYLAAEELILLNEAGAAFSAFLHDTLISPDLLIRRAEDQRKDDDRQRTKDLKGEL